MSSLPYGDAAPAAPRAEPLFTAVRPIECLSATPAIEYDGEPILGVYESYLGK